jgi:predicted transcriptional regulator
MPQTDPILRIVFYRLADLSCSMTQALEKAFQEAAKLPGEEQEIFAGFILDELAFRAAVREGIEAADRGEVVPLEDVKKMIPKWVSK